MYANGEVFDTNGETGTAHGVFYYSKVEVWDTNGETLYACGEVEDAIVESYYAKV